MQKDEHTMIHDHHSVCFSMFVVVDEQSKGWLANDTFPVFQEDRGPKACNIIDLQVPPFFFPKCATDQPTSTHDLKESCLPIHLNWARNLTAWTGDQLPAADTVCSVTTVNHH